METEVFKKTYVGSLHVMPRVFALTALLTVLLHANADSRILLVGPTRTFTSLQQVTDLLLPGDTVFVDGDATYLGEIKFTRAGSQSSRILVRGITVNGKRPVLRGGVNTVAFINGADHYTFENFDVVGGSSRGVYHQSDDLVLRGLVVHDCPNHGILGADNGSGSLLLEYCEVYRNGGGTQAHQIYMATDEVAHPGSVFRMQFCYVHDGVGGNNVKSRAERNEIYYNWIEGAVYHELELIGPDPAGGAPPRLMREDSDVVGNVLWKKNTASGGSASSYVVRFGGDGTGASSGRYRFVNNTVIMGTSATFRLFDSLESVEVHNNAFHLPAGGSVPLVRTVEAVWTGGEVIAGQNNWVHSGLTAVPLQWTGTVSGPDPGFADFMGGDLTPAEGSPLLEAGASVLASPPGHPFPLPLYPPMSHPPTASLLEPGTGAGRPVSGTIDLGAFERATPTDAGGGAGLPKAPSLSQNYPNPFNPTSDIGYQISEFRHVKLAVYDLLGREVAALVNEKKAPGNYEVRFDASNLASGVYLYRLQAGEFVQTKKMLVVR